MVQLRGISGYLAGRYRLARYFVGRLVSGVATLLVVSVLVFAAMHLVPGSFADVVLPFDATPAQRALLTHQYGLDRPLPVQYFDWLRHMAVGNFGKSLTANARVSAVLARRLPVTGELALISLALTLLVGIPLAVIAGMARGKFGRQLSRVGGAIAMSTPEFVTGSLFVYFFSRYSTWLRVGDYVPFSSDPVSNLRVMLLPAFTLSAFGIALVVRTGRDAVASVFADPHITASVARGEGPFHLIRHHVLRNASIPVVTVLAVFFGYLLGGAVIVENLFTLPGLGSAALMAINERDYPLVQSLVLVAAAAFISVNMLADFIYSVIDPRVARTRQ